MDERDLTAVLYDIGAVFADHAGMEPYERLRTALHAAINGWMDRNGMDTQDPAIVACGDRIMEALLAKPPMEDYRPMD